MAGAAEWDAVSGKSVKELGESNASAPFAVIGKEVLAGTTTTASARGPAHAVCPVHPTEPPLLLRDA